MTRPLCGLELGTSVGRSGSCSLVEIGGSWKIDKSTLQRTGYNCNGFSLNG